MSTENDPVFEEIKNEFLSEVSIDLEQTIDSYDNLLNEELRAQELFAIYRLVYFVKRGGIAMEMMDLAGFAHVVEDLVILLRSHEELLTPFIVDLLKKVGRAFQQRVEMIRNNDKSHWNIENLNSEVVSAMKKLEKTISKNNNPQSA